MDTVKLELTWEEYKLLVNCIKYTANTLNVENSQPKLLTDIEELGSKIYMSRKIVKDKDGV